MPPWPEWGQHLRTKFPPEENSTIVSQGNGRVQVVYSIPTQASEGSERSLAGPRCCLGVEGGEEARGKRVKDG